MHVYAAISIPNYLTDLLNHLTANVISGEINDFKLDELLIPKHDLSSFFKKLFLTDLTDLTDIVSSICGWL